MTTLFLGQDITGAAGTAAGPTVQSPPVTVTINPSGASTVTAGQPQGASAPTPSSPGTQVAAAPGNSSVAPLALARMNEDYLNLGYNPNALIIACVKYKDLTRLAAPTGNKYLEDICPSLFKLETLSELAKAAEHLVKARVLAPPVNPAAAAH